MVRIPAEIKETIKKYLTLLDENNVKIKTAYLFGSYAKGTETKWSDIDIAIVSDTFEGIRIKDREKIRKLTLSISSSLEVMPFHPKDFSEENPFAKEIIESGILLV